MVNEVPAVKAAIRVLERIAADAPRSVSPSTLATELGLNRSTCYNILATLQQAGWANNAGNRAGWTLGPGLMALAGSNRGALSVVVQEEIDELCRRLGYVVFAAQQDGAGGHQVIAVGDPGRGVRITVDVGDRFPFSAPALMQVHWAYRPWSEFVDAARDHRIQRFTEFTVVDTDELAAVFGQVREHGFGASIRQFDLGQGAVTAPVFGSDGQVSLVIGTLAFSSELNESNVEQVGAQVRAAAGGITARIGGIPPDRPDPPA